MRETDNLAALYDALTAIRGALVCAIVATHAALLLGSHGWESTGHACVLVLMTLSGFMRTPRTGLHYGRFLLAELCRLWPAYALCVALGAAAILRLPAPSIFGFYLGYDAAVLPEALAPDPPVWLICVEAWMVPLLPVFAWLGRGSPLRGLLIPPAYLLLGRLDWHLTWAAYYMAGAWAWRFLPRWQPDLASLAAKLPWWPGKVSYSLYLSHWPVLQACVVACGAWGLGLAAMLVPLAAWAVWRFVEQPSLMLSRRIGGGGYGATEAFFSGEKKQKNFVDLACVDRRVRDTTAKSLLVLFSRKEHLRSWLDFIRRASR